MAMVTCHLLWSILHLVFDLPRAGAIEPHIVVATIAGLSHHTSKFFKANRRLLSLRQEIGGRPGLARHKLTPRDYIEVAATGMSLGLGVCGAVEALDLALRVRNGGS